MTTKPYASSTTYALGLIEDVENEAVKRERCDDIDPKPFLALASYIGTLEQRAGITTDEEAEAV